TSGRRRCSKRASSASSWPGRNEAWPRAWRGDVKSRAVVLGITASGDGRAADGLARRPEGAPRSPGKCNRDKQLLWVQIVLARLVNDPKEPVLHRLWIRLHAVDPSHNQGCPVSTIRNANDVLSPVLPLCHGHSLKIRLILNS